MKNFKNFISVILTVVILCGCFTSCDSKNEESESVTTLIQIDDIVVLKNGKENNVWTCNERLSLIYDKNTDCIFLRSNIRHTTYSHYFTENGSIYHYSDLLAEGITSVNFITIEDLYIDSKTGSINLLYDERTKVVYMREASGMHASYAAYYAPNGLPYRYVNGQLVELDGGFKYESN